MNLKPRNGLIGATIVAAAAPVVDAAVETDNQTTVRPVIGPLKIARLDAAIDEMALMAQREDVYGLAQADTLP